MRIFTYRNKRAVRKTARILGCILLALALLVIGRVLYVQRYVTYTPDGVRLDYDQHLDYTGQEQLEPDPVDYPFETVLDAVAETDGEAESHSLCRDLYRQLRKKSEDFLSSDENVWRMSCTYISQWL